MGQFVNNIEMRYLVLENRARKPLLQALYENSESPVWTHLFMETEWRPYLSESPLVVKVSPASATHTWAIDGLEGERLSGLILESKEGFQAVLGWLRERLTVRFDSGRIGLLRFFDPVPSLEEKQWLALSAKSA